MNPAIQMAKDVANIVMKGKNPIVDKAAKDVVNTVAKNDTIVGDKSNGLTEKV